MTDIFDLVLVNPLNRQDGLFRVCWQSMEPFADLSILDHASVQSPVRTPLLVQSNRQSIPVLCRSISCGTNTSSRPTNESIMSLKKILSMTKSSPYGLYFFLPFPHLLWRVSMVKGRSGCTPLSISVCQFARSIPRPVADRNHLPPHSRRFCCACLFHSSRRQDPLSNSLPLACQLGYTSPLMRHCAV